jgi:hypothetical protein
MYINRHREAKHDYTYFPQHIFRDNRQQHFGCNKKRFFVRRLWTKRSGVVITERRRRKMLSKTGIEVRESDFSISRLAFAESMNCR